MRIASVLIAIGFLFPVLIVGAALLLPSTDEGIVRAPVQIGIDVDTRGNDDATLGFTDSCNRQTLQVGQTIDIDVTVRAIPKYQRGPNTGGIVGADFDLLFDPAVVQVNAFQSLEGPTILKASGEAAGSSYVDYNLGGETDDRDPPGITGNILAGILDQSTNVEDGDGVLGRLTLEAVGEGSTRLDLTYAPAGDDKPHLYGPNRDVYAVDESGATIIVGAGNCARPTPTTFPRIPDTAAPTTANVGATGDPAVSVPGVEPSNQARAARTRTDAPPWPLVAVGVGLCVIGIGVAFAYIRRRRV